MTLSIAPTLTWFKYAMLCIMICTCVADFTGDTITYLCNTTDNNCVPVGGQETMCERGLFIPDFS